jgi:hypothetical protein
MESETKRLDFISGTLDGVALVMMSSTQKNNDTIFKYASA